MDDSLYDNEKVKKYIESFQENNNNNQKIIQTVDKFI